MKYIILLAICITVILARNGSVTAGGSSCSITNISVPIGGVSGPVITFTANKNEQAYRVTSVPFDNPEALQGTVVYEGPKYRLVTDEAPHEGMNKLFEQCKTLADGEYSKETYRRMTTSFLDIDEANSLEGGDGSDNADVLDFSALEKQVDELESDVDENESIDAGRQELEEVQKALSEVTGEEYSSSSEMDVPSTE
jgi:hypothetical protein